jgi:hypothetical protein
LEFWGEKEEEEEEDEKKSKVKRAPSIFFLLRFFPFFFSLPLVPHPRPFPLSLPPTSNKRRTHRIYTPESTLENETISPVPAAAAAAL